MRIGILGLQGCYLPHEQKLRQLDVDVQRVVAADDLAGLSGLIIPGGESTTMLRTATPGLWEAIRQFSSTHSVWGVCAGSIVIAARVLNPEQTSLGLIDMTVVRNAYGAQNESFITSLDVALPGYEGVTACDGIFIRSPRICDVGDSVTTLIDYQGTPVMVESERHLATVFHPELTSDTTIHSYFVDKCATCK